MKQAIGYVRVSTKEQGDSKLGLEAQRKAIEEFATTHGYELLTTHEEVASGGSGLDERKVLRQALSQAKKLKCFILISKLDRLSREVSLVSSLMTQRVPFVCCDLGDSVDPFVLHIYAAFAESERKRNSDRTKAALKAIRHNIEANGYHISKAGNKIDKLGNHNNLHLGSAKGRAAVKAYANEFAHKHKPSIERMRAQGMTLQAIARELNDQGVPTQRNGTWTATSVSNLIKRWK